jgi:hypothetical protein
MSIKDFIPSFIKRTQDIITGVFTVNGREGPDVILNAGDLDLENVDNTSDINKPISLATQAALDLKEPANSNIQSHISNTNNPHSTTASQVGLGNVDNTADIEKNVLSATKLTTARNIAGSSFDGSSNINIDHTNLTDKLGNGEQHLSVTEVAAITHTNRSNLDVIDQNLAKSNIPEFAGIKFTIIGTGVQIVRIIGLDATYAQVIENITLDGTNIVTTTNSFLRINNIYAIQCGTSLAAVGTITAKGTGGAVVYSQIDIGLTADRQLIYTVPLGKTLYVTSLRVGAGIGGTSVKNEFCTFTAKATTDGTTVYNFFLPFAEIGVMNGSIQLPVEEVQKVPATTDIKASVIGDSAQGALCTCAVRGWLE